MYMLKLTIHVRQQAILVPVHNSVFITFQDSVLATLYSSEGSVMEVSIMINY